MKKSFMRGTWQKSRAFSPAVITEGGKVIWIAGHTGQKDPAGNSLAGDFDAQVRQTFKNIEATLKEAGASVKDIVTMSVFLGRRLSRSQADDRGCLVSHHSPERCVRVFRHLTGDADHRLSAYDSDLHARGGPFRRIRPGIVSDSVAAQGRRHLQCCRP